MDRIAEFFKGLLVAGSLMGIIPTAIATWLDSLNLSLLQILFLFVLVIAGMVLYGHVHDATCQRTFYRERYRTSR